MKFATSLLAVTLAFVPAAAFAKDMKATTMTTTTKTTTAAKTTATPATVDLNTASTTELAPVFGKTAAAKIVKARAKGKFGSPDDLVSKKLVSPAVLTKAEKKATLTVQ